MPYKDEEKRKEYERNRPLRDRLDYQRNYMANHRELQRQYSRNWNLNNPEKLVEIRQRYNGSDKGKNKRLREKYGISLEDYNKMFANQNGCCAICGRHQSQLPQPLFVDHNHSTEKVRGLLCCRCNHLLGNSLDNPEILLIAIEYLIKA